MAHTEIHCEQFSAANKLCSLNAEWEEQRATQVKATSFLSKTESEEHTHITTLLHAGVTAFYVAGYVAMNTISYSQSCYLQGCLKPIRKINSTFFDKLDTGMKMALII